MNSTRTVRTSRSTAARSSQLCSLAACLSALALALPTLASAQEAAPQPAASNVTPSVHAEGKGAISGRILNSGNGMYLSKALVVVEGTNIEALTEEYGNFELRDLPAGPVSLKISYTGLVTQSIMVTVEAGKTLEQEFKLGRSKLTAGKQDKDTVALDEFVVDSDRFRNATEIAINEERYSPTIKNVIAADAFGDIPDGNIGEFVKYIPGVQISTGYENAASNAADSNATSISVRGFDATFTSITIDGVPVTNASPSSLTRATGLDMMSINNASRVEVIKVATPDLPSNSPGGQINLITRSAFEFSRPEINWKIGVTMNSENSRDLLKKTDGPADKKTYKTLPSADFSVTIPLSSRMGFSVSGGWSQTFNSNYQGKSDYLYGNLGATGYTTAKNDLSSAAVNLSPYGGPNVVITTDPTDTTKKYISPFASIKGVALDVTNPLLYRYQVTDTPNTVTRTSLGMKFDWKPTTNQKLSVGYSGGLFTGVDAQRRLMFNMTTGKIGTANLGAKESYADWGPDYVYSYKPVAAAGTVAALAPKSQAQMTVTARDRDSNSNTAYVDYSFVRGPWCFDALVSASRSSGAYKDVENGHFSEVDSVSVSGSSLAFEGIKGGIPTTIRMGDTAGTGALNFNKLSSWGNLSTGANVKSGSVHSVDQDVMMRFNLRRDLDFIPSNKWISASFKTGFYRDQKMNEKWGRGTGYKYRYLGTTAPLSNFLETNYVAAPGLGNLGIQEWFSPAKIYEYYLANPTLFSDTYMVSNTSTTDNYVLSNYNELMNTNKKYTETSDQYFAMMDGKALHNRLSWVFGGRESVDSREGFGPMVDANWSFVRNADGSIYKKDSVYTTGIKIDSATSPLFTDTALQARLKTAGLSFPTAPILDVVERRKMQYKRGEFKGSVKGKPSMMASFAYDLTKDLELRLSYNRSYAKPEMENTLVTEVNGFAITEDSSVSGASSATHTKPLGEIKMKNPSLKPWTADSYDGQLAYYTPSGGKFAVSGFYKTVKDFHENYALYWDEAGYGEILKALGLQSDVNETTWEGYKISTTENGIGTAKTLGYELEANQNLKAIGGWGKYFQVFASYSHQYNKQENIVNSLRTLVNTGRPTSKDTASAGLNFSKNRLSVLLRGLYTDTKYKGSASIYRYNNEDIVLASWIPAVVNVDLNIRYSFTKRYGLFFNARNVFNVSQDLQRYDTETGYVPGYARNIETKRFGVNMVIGVTGSF